MTTHKFNKETKRYSKSGVVYGYDFQTKCGDYIESLVRGNRKTLKGHKFTEGTPSCPNCK